MSLERLQDLCGEFIATVLILACSFASYVLGHSEGYYRGVDSALRSQVAESEAVLAEAAKELNSTDPFVYQD